MKSLSGWSRWYLPLILLLLFASLASGGTPVYALSGSATSAAAPSDAAPTVGEQIVVAININVSGVSAPDNKLGSFTGSLDWNPAVLAFDSAGALPSGFTGVVNDADASSGHIAFNGANASGATGNVSVLSVTFDVVGAGTSTLDLGYSAMAAATTFVDLLPILTVTDGQVQAVGSEPGGPITYVGDVGSVTANSEGTSLQIPVGSGGAAAGNTIIVGFASRGAATYNEPTVSDTAGNTYHLAAVAVTYSHGRSYIFYAHLETALVSGNSITITTSSVPSRVAVASVFSGLLDADPLDQALGNPVLGDEETQQGNSPTVGPTGTTAQANELLIGMIGTEEATDAGTGTWLNDFVAGPQVKTSGASYEWRVSMGYRIVSAVGTYSAAKTVTNNPYWAASIATFRAGAAGTTHNLTMAVDPVGSGTTNPSVGTHVYAEGAVVSITATPNSGYQFDRWSGACTGSGTCQVTMDSDKSVTAHFEAVSTGAITYLAEIGNVTTKTTGTSLVITTDTAVAAGNGIIVAFSTYGDPDYEISVADSVGNTYEQAAQAQCYEHGRTYIFAAYNVTALPSGGTITITHTSVQTCAALAISFSGLLDDALDQSLGNPVPGEDEAISGTAPTVGPTGTTAVANELLFAAVGTEGPIEDAAGTWGNSLTAGPRIGTTGSTYDTNRTLSVAWRIVSSTGAYTASKSGITDRYWGAAIATFKGGVPIVTHTLTMAVDPVGGGTTNPAVGAHTYDEGSVVDVTATPSSGYQFDHWSGACSGTGACQVTMSSDLSVTAHFTTISPADTSITDAPADPTNATGASFSFTSSEAGATFECRLDAGAFSACTSPTTYSGLSDGSHTFEVRATGASGSPDPTPASHTWTIDTAAPQTAFASVPAALTGSGEASFTFIADEPGSTFECQLDAGGFGACTTPKELTGLAEGAHTFQVRAIDPAGNVDPTPASHSWTIDMTAPDTTITSAPASPSGSADASFSFTSTEGGSTFECALDGGAFDVCTSPKAYTGLASGPHTFEVRATDAVGNTDLTPASHAWTIDTAAPDTTITAAPANPSSSADASFEFDGTEVGSTFECQLDGGGFAVCTSPKPYTGLADGEHTFDVRAIDPAANPDPSPASHSWTIDTMAPDTAITSAPANPSGSADASFDFDGTEVGATFECQLDGSGFAVCTSPNPYTGLADGAHTFEVRAIDPAGNVDASPASHAWTIDTTGPDTTITAAPVNPSNSGAANFSFESTEAGSTFACRLDGEAFAGCTSPKTYSSLTDGSHTFEVLATDALGNPDPTPASHTWAIDTVPPETALTSAPDAQTGSVDASLSFISSEPGSTFECQLDAGGYGACTSPKDYLGLAEGAHTFEVRATDPAGNVDPTPASHVWNIDTTAPDTTIATAPADPSSSADASFSFSSTEGGSTFACQLDGGGFGACTSPKAYSGLADGAHTFEVQATDAVGNADATPASHTWTIDTIAPDTSITAQPANPSGSASASFSFTSDDATATFACQLDGGGYATCTSPVTYNGLADGAYAFDVRATDPAGNTDASPASYGWVVDTTAPDTTLTDVPEDPSGSADAEFSFMSGDATATFECQLDGGGFTACQSPKSYTGLDGGSHTFDVRAIDGVGNIDPSPATYTWWIDRDAPETNLTDVPSDPSSSRNISIGFDSDDPTATFECQLDGGGYDVCTSPQTYIGLGYGDHFFEVRAVDTAGNPDPTPSTFGWTVNHLIFLPIIIK